MMAVTDTRRVGVLGATSLVGAALLSELKAQSFAPIAYSRRRAASAAGRRWPRRGDVRPPAISAIPPY